MPVSTTSVQTSPSQDPDIWQSLGVNYRPSMLIDFERGRPAELEMTIAVSTPMLETSTPHSEKVRGKPVFSSAFGGKDASWPSLLL